MTGASGRLGLELCKAMSDDYEIAAIYNSHRLMYPSQETVGIAPVPDVPRVGRPVLAIQADLRSSSDRRRAIELCLARYGRVDLLINGAAVVRRGDIPSSARLLETAAEQFEMNAIVPLQFAVEVFNSCWNGGNNPAVRRHIINISSAAALRNYLGRGQSVYAATKAALNTLTREMAAEFKELGVRVNAIAPDSFPNRVNVDDVIRAIRFLDDGNLTGKIVPLLSRGTEFDRLGSF